MQIKTVNLQHIFDQKTSTEFKALQDVSTEIKQGEFITIIGRTGSGKTTFIEHLNALNLPTDGEVILTTEPIKVKKKYVTQFIFNSKVKKNKNIHLIRRKIGVVFQFAEYQLFEDTIEKDIIFGPLNMGVGVIQAEIRAKEYIEEKSVQLRELNKDGKLKQYLKETARMNTPRFKESVEKLASYIGISEEATEKAVKKLSKPYFKLLDELKTTVENADTNSDFSTALDDFLKIKALSIINSIFQKYQKEIVKVKAKHYLKLVGLPDDYIYRSPFSLSGGQKRRVALAGILAMEPDVLIFDEPTAGLDPEGEKDMYEIFHQLNMLGKTIIIVTHNLDHVLEHSERTMLFMDGKLVEDGKSIDIMYNEELLLQNKLQPPKLVTLVRRLEKENSKLNIGKITSIEQLVEKVVK